MTYEMYRYVFLGCAIACGVFLAISAVLFFTLEIPQVISNLSGRTARKAIENIRLQNERSGDKGYQSSAVNLQRGKLTDKISKSGRLLQKDTAPIGTGALTEKIATRKIPRQQDPNATEVLTASEETALLSSQDAGQTELLQSFPASGETEVLQPQAPAMGETASLRPQNQPLVLLNQPFVVEYEVTFIHTNEVIA